jgi:Ca2+/Na+ antiporter
MWNLQYPKPIFLFLLYMFVRAFFIARRQERYIYARALLMPIVLFVYVNLYTFFQFPKWTLWILIVPFVLVSIYSWKGDYDVRKGKLPADKEATKQREYVIELVVVLILSFIIAKILGFDYFTAGF